jgi:hypothetical protein
MNCITLKLMLWTTGTEKIINKFWIWGRSQALFREHLKGLLLVMYGSYHTTFSRFKLNKGNVYDYPRISSWLALQSCWRYFDGTHQNLKRCSGTWWSVVRKSPSEAWKGRSGDFDSDCSQMARQFGDAVRRGRPRVARQWSLDRFEPLRVCL